MKGIAVSAAVVVAAFALAAPPRVEAYTIILESVKRRLGIPDGCYPVSYDATADKIGTVCRGQQGWVPEGLQYFNGIPVTTRYRNRLGQMRQLSADMDENVGPGPWFQFYFGELDRLRIPRPK